MRRFAPMFAMALAALIAVPATADDLEIANKIAAKLSQKQKEKVLKDFRISVDVDEGVAWVSGHVKTEEQRHDVLEITRRVKGVKLVVNDLAVGAEKSTETPAESKPEPETLAPTQPVASDLPEPELKVPTQPVTNNLLEPGLKASTSQVANDLPETELTRGGTEETLSQPDPPVVPNAEGEPLQSQVSDLEKQLPIAVAQPFPENPTQQVATVSTQQTATVAKPIRAVPVAVNGRPALNGQAVSPHAGMRPAPYAGRQVAAMQPMQPVNYCPPVNNNGAGGGYSGAVYDQPSMPGYAWPSYASYPNYAAVTYPQQYSPQAWPYIGPFYPYPQVPLGWRKVCLEWDDGWWMLDFSTKGRY